MVLGGDKGIYAEGFILRAEGPGRGYFKNVEGFPLRAEVPGGEYAYVSERFSLRCSKDTYISHPKLTHWLRYLYVIDDMRLLKDAYKIGLSATDHSGFHIREK